MDTSLLKKLSIKGLEVKKFLTILVLLAALVLVWKFLLSPQYKQFGQVRLSKVDTETQLQNLNKEIAEIESLAGGLAELPEADLVKINRALPFGQDLEEFLANMHKLAQQSGLLITNMYVRSIDLQTKDVSELRKLQLTISLRGKYQDFLDFMGILERHVRLVDVQSVTVGNIASFSSELLGKVEVLQINITGHVYYLDPVPEVPIFPYGREIDLSLLELDQFKDLQVLLTPLPTDTALEPNPFAPR